MNPDDREPYRVRSRSRERERDRQSRDERDIDLVRRDKDDRDRDERTRREIPPYRPESRNSAGPRTPLPSRSTSSTTVPQANYDRYSQQFRDARETATEGAPGPAKDLERSEASLKRVESDRFDARNASPPPQAPPVPAFGSIPTRAMTAGVMTSGKEALSKGTSIDLARDAPSGPRSDLLSHAPTAPKAQQYLGDIADAPRGPGGTTERYSRPPPILSSAASGKPPFEQVQVRNWSKTFPQATTETSTQQTIRKAVEEQGRNGISASSPDARSSTGENPVQSTSPMKIPTGPRADRAAAIRQPPPAIRGGPSRPPAIMPGRPRPTHTLTWLNPEIKRAPRGPSIMNTVPTKRDYGGDEKARRGPTSAEQNDGSDDAIRRAPVPDHARVERSKEDTESKDVVMGGTGDDVSVAEGSAVCESPTKSALPDFMGEDPEDLSSGDDLDLGDERDFAEAEEKFEQKMQALEAGRPPTPRSNPVLLELLEELDALASALEEKIRDGSTDENIKVESTNLGLPSPKAEEEDAKRSTTDGSPTLAIRARPLTPPIESLPFLISGPPTPFSEIDGLQQDPAEHEAIKKQLTERFAEEGLRLDDEYELIRGDFARKYRPWRMTIEDLEDNSRAEQAATSSPPPEPAPSTAQSTPSLGRRRGFASEYMFQSVIKESEETAAREEQQRREREERVYVPPDTFNDQREAVVPEMMNPFEAKDNRYADTNNFVPHDQALNVFGYYPKKDDFTPEEHTQFLVQYVQTPKKFGEISSKIEGRDYQACVLHYYATKLSVSYKQHEQNFWKSKRGRRIANARGAIRNQASSLMTSTFDAPADQEAQNVALTEKGRPRRAAAPTFGEVTDGDQSNSSATPARRTTVGKESAPASAEKTTGKKTRQMATKEKPGRKPKAQLLPAAPGPTPPAPALPGPPPLGPSPQKSVTQGAKFVNKTTPVDSAQHFNDLEGAQVLAELTKGETYQAPPVQNPQSATWLVNQPPPIQASQPRAASDGIHPEPPSIGNRRNAGEQPNSYWLVSETQDLKNYLAYFGLDYQAIADRIPSKTSNMVSTSPHV